MISRCPSTDADLEYIGVNGGPGLAHAGFEPLLRLDTARACVHLYDQRGTGRSPAPADNDYSLPAHVHDLRTVVADKPSVILLAGSWGAVVAMSYALQRPPSLRGLVLISPAPMTWSGFLRAEAKLRERIAWLTAVGTIAPRPGDADACDELARIYPAYFSDPDHAPAFANAAACSVTAGTATIAAIRDYDLLEQSTALDIPVLLLRGAAEPEIFGDEAKDDVVQLVDSSKLTVREVPGCGHAMLVECRDEVLAEIERWVAGE